MNSVTTVRIDEFQMNAVLHCQNWMDLRWRMGNSTPAAIPVLIEKYTVIVDRF
jgi:hypothetical protein